MCSQEHCCLIGYVNDECHKTNLYKSERKYHEINSLSHENIELLRLRIPLLQDIACQSICDYHYKIYVDFYSLKIKKCCDPSAKHSKIVTTNLRVITLDLAQKIKKLKNMNLVPGDKFCINCLKDFQQQIRTFEEQTKYCVNPMNNHRDKVNQNLTCLQQNIIEYLKEVHNVTYSDEHKICDTCKTFINSEILNKRREKVSASASLPQSECDQPIAKDDVENNSSEVSQGSSGLIYQTNSQKRTSLNEILDAFGIPPFKRQKLSNERVAKEGVKIVQKVVNQFSNKFVYAYNVELPICMDIQQLAKESVYLKEIISNIKSKYNLATKVDEKISLLTLLPENWSIKDFQKYFQCSPCMIHELRKVKKNIGVLGQRVKKDYLKYSVEVRQEIIDYYLNDFNSSECSGEKECIKIKVPGQPSISVQKRIMWFDDKDDYDIWIKEKNCASVPCFAFFYKLKPKQCISAGKPGTHNNCVCDVHQNVKLKLSAALPAISYKEVIDMSVCSVENKTCILRKCDKCPKKETVHQILSNNIEDIDTKNVTYNVWRTGITIDFSSKRVSLHEESESMDQVLKSVIEDIYEMTDHHFISFNQRKYYSHVRDTLDVDTGAICIDFAENYVYVAQDAINSLYFHNTSATLFTAILHYRDHVSNEKKFQSFCVLSESHVHQAYSVNVFQGAVVNVVKEEYDWIKYLIYFTDGAPTQFKNKNHLTNMCYHEQDFGIKVKSCHVFGRAHGKSEPDGIGAAAKRIARRAALQRKRIMDAKALCDHLSSTDSNIRFLYVSEQEVSQRGKKLQKRFSAAKTISETRLYHSFEPINEKQMRVKIHSFDTESTIVNMV